MLIISSITIKIFMHKIW